MSRITKDAAFEKAVEYIRENREVQGEPRMGYYEYYPKSEESPASHSVDIFFDNMVFVVNVYDESEEVEIVIEKDRSDVE